MFNVLIKIKVKMKNYLNKSNMICIRPKVEMGIGKENTSTSFAT
jgi:hypothetical protein